MRIGIDARFYGTIGKGLGRYTQKLIEQLERIDQENEYLVFLRRENFDEYHPQNPNFRKVLADCSWYSLTEQWKMPRLLGKYQLDLVHFPHFNVPLFYRRPFVLTIHDLILLHFPTVRSTTRSRIGYWIKFLTYRIVIRSAIFRAKKIIAVSNFTRDDILRHYAVPPEKMAVTYEAADNFKEADLNFPNVDETGKKYGIIRPYILYVGNAYPHKNLDRLISAFNGVSENHPELRLVLVGKEDFFYRRLKKAAEKSGAKNIVFAGFVPDQDLRVIYQGAEAFIFPSLYEGFGIPPLEAMRQGVPVIASDHPCMREVLGEAALYFDAEKESEIEAALEKILSDQELCRNLREAGARRVRKYSWSRMAEETRAIYKSV